ncbi:MAG: HAD family hydrolase [Acidimicrobiia bacterium]
MNPDPLDPGGFELVVFDFDGTLCDSADIKTQAFSELYLDERGLEFSTTVLDYHMANAGVSRYTKIRHIETEFIGAEPTREQVDAVAARFSRMVEDAVVAAPLFDGVTQFLGAARWRARIAVASATPEDELLRIVDRKGIGGFFDAVNGSPRTKADIIGKLSERFAVGPDRIVMVGDQPSDQDAAKEARVTSLIIAPPAPWVETVHRVDTFAEAADWLNRRIAGSADHR